MRHFLPCLAILLASCGSGGHTTAPPPAPSAPTLSMAPSTPGFYSGPVLVRFISFYGAEAVSVEIGDVVAHHLPAGSSSTLGTLPGVGVYFARVVFADGAEASGWMSAFSPSVLLVAAL